MLKFKMIGLLMLLLATVSSAAEPQADIATDTVATAPQAVVDDTRHTLPAVIEGTEVRHDFVIKNTGNASLEIENVKTG